MSLILLLKMAHVFRNQIPRGALVLKRWSSSVGHREDRPIGRIGNHDLCLLTQPGEEADGRVLRAEEPVIGRQGKGVFVRDDAAPAPPASDELTEIRATLRNLSERLARVESALADCE